MIKVEHLTKIYKSSKSENVVANNDISFELANNGLVFITGKSGSGKSTLLNILGGLDKKSSGNYFVNGKSIDEFDNLDDFRNEFVGFVFQDFNLIESMTVYENLKFVLSIQENFDESKILEALDLVGLNGFSQRKINELSGWAKAKSCDCKSDC